MDNTTQSPLPNLEEIGNLYSGGVLNPLALQPGEFEVPTTPMTSNITGSQISGVKPEEVNASMDYALDFKNHIENVESYAQDPYKYAKNWSYDASHTGKNFQRYYNVPKVFKQIGFSPWKDNETEFNKRMSWWDDYKRALGQSVSLAGASFNSSLPWNAWSSDTTDDEAAQDFTKAMAIGHSGRTGAGRFFNDLTLNAGFTLGIGAEFALEEIIMWGGSVLTTGATAPAAIVATTARLAKMAKQFTTMSKAGKLLSKSYEALHGLADVTKAREFFTASRMGKTAGKLADAVTPNTFKYIKELAKESKAVDGVMTMARAAKGVGAFYRDSRMLAAALTESKLEGGMVEQELFEKLSNEFYEKNGRTPNAEEYANIHEIAGNAGHETFLWNLPALWISNKIVFDKSFKGLKAFREYELEYGKGIKAKLTYDKAAAKAGKQAWNVVKEDFKKDMLKLKDPKSWYPKNLLRTMALGIGKYGKANLVEGLQETYQDSMSMAMKSYYNEIYKDPLMTSSHAPWGRLPHVGKAFGYMTSSQQGLETFASGFLMGGLVQIPQHIMYDFLPKRISQMSNPEQYKAHSDKADADMVRLSNALNAVTQDPTKYFNADYENLVIQKIHKDRHYNTLDNDEVKENRDSKSEADINHIHTLIRTGKIDLVLDALKDMKNLTGPELEQAYGEVDKATGDSKAYYTKQIDNFISLAENIKERTDYVDSKYTNPWNPWKYKKNSKEFFEEALRQSGFEDAKKMAVFARVTFDETMERMSKILTTAGSERPLKKASAHDMTILFDLVNTEEEIKQLQEEIKAFAGDPKQKKILDIKTQKLTSLETYKTAVEAIQASQSRAMLTYDLASASDEDKKLATEDYNKSAQELQKAYYDHLKVLAKEYDEDLIENDKIQNTFVSLLDFFRLDTDKTNLAQTVNLLENPQYFIEYAMRSADAKKMIHQQRVELFRTSYKAVQGANDLNELIGALLDMGVYFDPEELAAFKNGKHPKHFISALDGSEIKANSKKYDEIEVLLEKYEKAGGFEFNSKYLAEERFDSTSREKNTDDTRTYKEIAKQFGFDPKDEVTELAMQDVLDKIISSKYASPREKALAKKLREIVSPLQKMKFSKKHGVPGSYDPQTGIIIDARYASSNYTNGVHPIEYLILNQQLQALTLASLIDTEEADTVEAVSDTGNLNTEAKAASQYDAEFDEAITKLRQAALDYYDTLPDDTKKTHLGLLSNSQFVAAAMTSEEFQKFLHKIDYESTNKSAWAEFLDTLYNFFAKLFNLDKSNVSRSTVLNEAIYLITTKIDTEKGVKIKPGEKVDNTTDNSEEKVETKPVPEPFMTEDGKAVASVETDEGIILTYMSKGTHEIKVEDLNELLPGQLVVYANFKDADNEDQVKLRNALEAPEKGEEVIITTKNENDDYNIENRITTTADAQGKELYFVRTKAGISKKTGKQVTFTVGTKVSLTPEMGSYAVTYSEKGAYPAYIVSKINYVTPVEKPVVNQPIIPESENKSETEDLTRDNKKKYKKLTGKRLGWPKHLVDAMDLEEFNNTADNNIKYQTPEEVTEKTEEILDLAAVTKLVHDKYAAAKDINELETVKLSLIEQVALGKIPVDLANAEHQARLEELDPITGELEVNKLVPGMVIELNNRTQYTVEKVTKTKITLSTMDSTVSYTKKQLSNEIGRITSIPEVSPEQEKKIDKIKQEATNTSTANAAKINERKEAIKNKSAEEVEEGIDDCL